MKLINLISSTLLVTMSISLTAYAGSVSYMTARYNMNLPLDEEATSTSELVGIALVKAEAAIAQATYKTSDYFLTQKFIKVRDNMKNLVVTWPDESEDFKICRENYPAGGYNFAGTPLTHLCRVAIVNAQGRSDFLAQVIIHEAAHAANFEDECEATEIEVNATRLSDLKLQFTNTYWAKCGIK